MPNSLPFPVRVAAGLVSTGLDTLRGFPQNLPTIGVEIAGHVTKAGLQVRQQFVELALRGDDLLRSEPAPQEHPAWAHFDDEDPAPSGNPDWSDGSDGPDGSDGIADVPEAPGTSDTADTPETSEAESAPQAVSTGDALLPGYDAMTAAQVRSQLRGLGLDAVEQLLAHEHAAGNRPAMVTLLTNRIVTLRHR